MDARHTDVLVLGGGLTAWMAVHTLLQKRDCRVLMLCDGQGASPWVHGFNVPLHAEDSVQCFYEDTRRSGYRQNDPDLVRILCGESPEMFQEAQALGLTFNRTAQGAYQLLRPLGATHPRVASVGNETGPAILRELRRRVEAHPGFAQKRARALRLLCLDGRVQGALAWDQDQSAFFAVSAGSVLLATGGFARIYPFSTNRPDGGGDGVAMAYHAGADLVDLEFVQFEPSAAVYPEAVRGQGMITTLFYEGAVLKNALGERFMLAQGDQAERVDKDVLARCIAKEIQEGRGTPHGGVWFDATEVDSGRLESAYPLYVQRYRRLGIELGETPVELAPAPHTTLGGVRIDASCRTTLPGLLAAGEAAGGLHGANRIGGNAGLETLVFGRRAGRTLAGTDIAPGAPEKALTAWAEALAATGEGDIAQALAGIRGRMEEALETGAGVLRSGEAAEASAERMRELLARLSALPSPSAGQAYARLRLENDLTAALLALLSIRERGESVGCHVRCDCPQRESARYRVRVRAENGAPAVRREDWTQASEEE